MPTDLEFPLKRKKGYARLVSCESVFLNFEVSKKVHAESLPEKKHFMQVIPHTRM